MTADTTNWYEGTLLDIAELEAASEYLHSKNLIRGIQVAESRAVLRARVTDLGSDCIDDFGGSVSEYLRRNERAQGGATHVNFHAPVSGNVAWASQDVSQTAATTGVSGTDLASIITDIKEAAPRLGLLEKEAAQLSKHLDIIEGELAEHDPDPAVVTTFTKRIAGVLQKAAESAIATSLTVGLRLAAEKAGIEL